MTRKCDGCGGTGKVYFSAGLAPDTCTKCVGTGWLPGQDDPADCKKCHGAGVVPGEKGRLKVCPACCGTKIEPPAETVTTPERSVAKIALSALITEAFGEYVKTNSSEKLGDFIADHILKKGTML